MVVDRTRLAPACPRWVFVFSLAGKFKSMRVRFVMLVAARAAALFEKELSLQRCLVALSKARGDGLSRRERQSWPIKVLQRGAIV